METKIKNRKWKNQWFFWLLPLSSVLPKQKIGVCAPGNGPRWGLQRSPPVKQKVLCQYNKHTTTIKKPDEMSIKPSRTEGAEAWCNNNEALVRRDAIAQIFVIALGGGAVGSFWANLSLNDFSLVVYKLCYVKTMANPAVPSQAQRPCLCHEDNDKHYAVFRCERKRIPYTNPFNVIVFIRTIQTSTKMRGARISRHVYKQNYVREYVGAR